jgi:hypothetical protein
VAISVAVGIEVFSFGILQVHIRLSLSEKAQDDRPCKTNCNLREKERFNKGARTIIHSSCLLPVLSDGGLNFLVTSFECFGVCRFTAAAIAVHPARKIHRRRPPLI